MQNSIKFCISEIEIPQPILPYYTPINIDTIHNFTIQVHLQGILALCEFH